MEDASGNCGGGGSACEGNITRDVKGVDEWGYQPLTYVGMVGMEKLEAV